MSDFGRLIPHRPPFLLLERLLRSDADGLSATACPAAGDELWSRVFAGHYPGSPIVPGVLLCEMVFQAAAAWLADRAGDAPEGDGRVPVVARVQGAKFRRPVAPGEALVVTVVPVESAGGAHFLKGAVSADGKTVAQVEFSVAYAPRPGAAAREG